MVDQKKTALIAGATGVVGRNLLRHLAAAPDWNVIAVSRRKPDIAGDFAHLALDLMDKEACAAARDAFAPVTHVFYAAYIERPTWSDMVGPNMAMLENLVEAVAPAAPHLTHVNLMHGTKWYGNHLGPFKTPAEETDPPHMPPNFYFDQQAYISNKSNDARWTWSSARPHGICGFAIGNPMNLVMVLAVYATVSKALGLPLRHPGSDANAQALYNVTDAGLLARACVWMSTDTECANEPFNVTNGDVFRWTHMWPAFAEYFEMDLAPPQRISLADMMADKATLWAELTRQHGLREIPYDQLVSWNYGDFVFTPEFDIMSSMTKARRYGFHEFIDSREMFLRQFDELRQNKIIPTL
ncbi:MAG: SDR family oxidoreductase [Pseudomonadota bacterium]